MLQHYVIICKVLGIQSLSSGSRGNVIYIASDTTRILVDVGLSLPQLLKRLNRANIDPNTIDAILVTHEHSDHIFGVEQFLKKFPAKLHLHIDTAHLFQYLPNDRINHFGSEFQIGDITVDFFPVPHDSQFCFGYNFKQDDVKISLATDLGRMTDDILKSMSDSQIVLLECNHDLLKLSHNRKYPHFLKRRITSSRGHLSNPCCALAIYQLATCGVNQFILAHLSEENNSPTLAYNFVRDFLQTHGIIEGQDVWIDVALQNEIGNLFHCTIDRFL